MGAAGHSVMADSPCTLKKFRDRIEICIIQKKEVMRVPGVPSLCLLDIHIFPPYSFISLAAHEADLSQLQPPRP